LTVGGFGGFFAPLPAMGGTTGGVVVIPIGIGAAIAADVVAAAEDDDDDAVAAAADVEEVGVKV